MSSPNTGAPSAGQLAYDAKTSFLRLAPAFLGLAIISVPTYIDLDQQVWSQVGQGHGPVMLALAIWLAWQRWDKLKVVAAVGEPMLGAGVVALSLLLYVLGRSQSVFMFEVGAQLLLVSGLLLFHKGWPSLRVMWFPVFFLVFLVPLPSQVVDAVTGPLKMAVSAVAEEILHYAGLPVGRAGVKLTIGNYELLVADACAGLNSIFALEAVGVFYLSIVGYSNPWRNIALAVFVLPISFVSNVIRVIILVLITYYLGDEVGQGFAHEFAGVLLFVVATLLTIGADKLIGLFIAEAKKSPAG